MADLIGRLENWGRAWRTRAERATAASQEGSYRNRWGKHYDYDPRDGENGVTIGVAPTFVPPVDWPDASEVERAVCALDIFNHVILGGCYVRQWRDDKTLHEARRAAGEPTKRGRGDFASYERMARALLSQLIDRPAVIRRERAAHRARVILEIGVLTPVND